MGKLNTPFTFTGRIQLLSFYPMKGSDAIIVRRAKSHSAKRIKTDPRFARTLLNSFEFGARSNWVNGLYRAWLPIKSVFDHNVYNELISRTRTIQKLETTGGLGKRGLTISKTGKILEGLQFNKTFLLENILSSDLDINIDLQTASATVRIPQLIPGTHFHNLPNVPFFQLVAFLQSVPDVSWQETKFKETSDFVAGHSETGWQKSMDIFPGAELKIDLSARIPHPTSLVLSFAVLFSNDSENAVKYAGAGKILKVENGIK
jgi:hypothetical protein